MLAIMFKKHFPLLELPEEQTNLNLVFSFKAVIFGRYILIPVTLQFFEIFLRCFFCYCQILGWMVTALSIKNIREFRICCGLGKMETWISSIVLRKAILIMGVSVWEKGPSDNSLSRQSRKQNQDPHI